VTSPGKQIGLFGATMIVAGNMIGSGVFLMPAAMAQIGTISILGWLVAVPAAILLAIVFARMAAIMPAAGGPYAWAKDALGNYTGFQSNFLYWLGNVVGNIAIAVSVIGYLSLYVPLLASPLAHALATIAVIWLTTLANIAGPRLVAFIESATTMVGILPIVMVAVIGWAWFSPTTFAAGWNPTEVPAITAAATSLSVMFWAFTGIESAAVVAAVVKEPAKNVPRATILGVCLSAVVYVLSTTVVLGIVPLEQLAASEAPFALALGLALGPAAAAVLSVCAILKATGSLGGWTLLVAQTAKAAADDGLFARLFARTNANGVPVAGLITVATLSSVVVFLTLAPTVGGVFNRLVSISVLLILPAYIFACVSLVREVQGAMRWVAIGTAMLCVYIASSADPGDALIALLLVLVTAPLFVMLPKGSEQLAVLLQRARRPG
jgi:arginine:agmatine antiporter